ncbi:MAG: D-glycero-alpha-D-manno-heptose 1-phosphate guanylyltransferase [Limisphaerales bacterium]|jgi:D-glycero-alpha-D-manno-heptose 1-phosphate guanylyltransferase
MQFTEAVVLAGGMGTRLKSVISDLPKPMAPVAGRPFLEHVLDELLIQGIEKAILAVGYKADMIREHFGTSYKGMEIEYSVEFEPLGTGGGIQQASFMSFADAIFVVNGDTLFKADLAEMEQQMLVNDSIMELALKEMNDFDRYGTVLTDDIGFVTGFQEKRHTEKGFINGGIYLLRPEVFSYKSLPEKYSFEKEILEGLCDQGKFHACKFDEYFIDIGIPEDYAKADKDLK